jgi:hypothetical protein
MPAAIFLAILGDDSEFPPHDSALFPGHGMLQTPLASLAPVPASMEVAQ